MAGNNSIQILRGNTNASTEIAIEGQPVWNPNSGYLYIGDNSTQIKDLEAIKASYADNANHASYATNLTSILSINDGGTGGTNARTAMKNLMMNVATSSNPVDSEYLVFATSSTAYRYNYGYIKNDILSEVSVPSSVANANYANFANTAYRVSGSNVSGSVANATYATTAGKVSHSFKLNVNGTTYTYNGSNVDIDILDDNPVVTLSKTTAPGAIVYTNSTGRINWLSHPGVSGRVLTSGSSGRIYWSTPATKTVYVMEDVNAGTIAYEPDSQGIPSATNIRGVINQLFSYGHSSSSSALNAVGAYGGKSVTGIYADSSTSLSIKCSDGTTQSRGSTFPITIHKL